MKKISIPKLSKTLVFFALLSFCGVTRTAAQFQKVFDFDGPKGACPQGSLILAGNMLYGTTPKGGTNNMGVVFKMNKITNEVNTLVNFTGSTNGSSPTGFLILSGATLYGMTNQGGAHNYGIIFKVDTLGNGFTDLFDFSDTDGVLPRGSLILSGNVLYGMTNSGGANNYGVIFKINTDGSGYTKLFNFNGTASGAGPMGSLTISDNVLYGMTSGGGINGGGVVFKVNADGNNFSKLVDFDSSSSSDTTKGNGPQGSLVLDNNVLYGMTYHGGKNSAGVLFKVNTDGSGFTKLLNCGNLSSGMLPTGSFIISGKTLYAMTMSGGASVIGTAFKINTDGTNFFKFIDFDGTNKGKFPAGDLTQSENVFYGMATQGGPILVLK